MAILQSFQSGPEGLAASVKSHRSLLLAVRIVLLRILQVLVPSFRRFNSCISTTDLSMIGL